jgi:hypothetical protein
MHDAGRDAQDDNDDITDAKVFSSHTPRPVFSYNFIAGNQYLI